MLSIQALTELRLIRRLSYLSWACLLASTATCWAQNQPPAGNNDALPPGFRPPRSVAKEVTEEKPLTTEEAYVQWKRKEAGNFLTALKQQRIPAGSPFAKQIEDGCRIRVQRLSIVEHRLNLKPVRTEIYRDVHFQSQPAAREIALKAIASEAEKLLQGNLAVRLQALILLSELEAVPINAQKNPAPILYADSLTLYFKVLNDKAQPEAVKLMAAALTEKVVKESGLTTSPPAKLRIEAGNVLVPILQSREGGEWLQEALVAAVHAVNLPTLPGAGGTQQPLIANCLQSVIADNKRTYNVRARAALAFGSLNLPSSGINTANITGDMLKLAREISNDYNAGRINSVKAAFMLQDIYLALKGWKTAAPLDKNIASAYSAVLPPVKHALKNSQSTTLVPMDRDALDLINAIIGASPNAGGPKATAGQAGINAKTE